MKKMEMAESVEIGKLAKQLRLKLEALSRKYYDDESYAPDADLYSRDYTELLKLQDEIRWWTI